MTTPCIIRKGTLADIPAAFELVKELAIYEKALDQVSNTVERMGDDFTKNYFDYFVAECEGKVVGISLYYFRYSTWKSRRLYLEDIVIQEDMRGKGIGKLLFDATVKEAHDTQCSGMMWQVLDWNTSAITFYRKYGTRFDDEWLNCHLDF